MKLTPLLLLFFLFNSLLLSQNRWEKLNGPPGGLMVRIYALGDTLIATGENFKIFLSTNRGDSWKQFQFPTPNNSNILRIMGIESLGDYFYASTWYNGIFKSKDLKNWQKLTYPTSCYSIKKDFIGNIYAGSEHGEIYRSSDEGLNWILEYSDVNRYPIWKILVASDSSVWAGTKEKVVKKSHNLDWIEINFQQYFHVHSIMEDDYKNIYASDYSYMKKTTNNGITWVDMDSSRFLINNSLYDFIYNKRIIAVFNDETGFFGNGWGAAVSDDRGISWRWWQKGLPPKISGIRLAKSEADTYLITWGAGVFKSTDFGDSWFDINNGINCAVTRQVIKDNDDVLYTASWASGLAKSTDRGNSWKMINKGVDNVNFYSIVSDRYGKLMAGSDNGLYSSSDKGENWIQTNTVGNNNIFNLKTDKQNRIYCLTYGSGLYRTSDFGQHWVRLDKNFISGYVYSIDIDTDGNLYVGTFGGAIYKSTNDGIDWSNVYLSTVDNTAIGDIIAAPNGNIFATCIKEGVLRSENNGLSWQVVKHETGTMIYNFPLGITSKGEIFTIDSKDKIFRSKDNGNTWVDISDNIPKLNVRSISVDNKDDVYLATDESVWKMNPDSLTSITENHSEPKEYFLSQNYPNPFNPTTTIKYSLAETGIVTLSIYDVLGREVINLINEEKPSGEYQTVWNAASYPSGVYLLRMNAGKFTETRKLILVK